MSVEALLVAIIGGMGTVFGPLIGAIVLHALGEVAKQVTGNAPGLNLVLYGVLLILALRFLPNGLAGLIDRLRGAKPEARRCLRCATSASVSAAWRRSMMRRSTSRRARSSR